MNTSELITNKSIISGYKIIHTTETHFFQRAIDLARLGQYSSASPNPCVGCVLVKDGQIIGEGWHQRAGEPHAEANAIQNAISREQSTIGATAYVTLEPCNHKARTPPCTQALIQSGIKKVVVGMEDCDYRVSGKGISSLKKQGVEVAFVQNAEQKKQLEILLRGYINRQTKNRPWVRVKIASSLDGKIALENGDSQWITSAESRLNVHYQRLKADLILTSASTIRSDDPILTARIPPEKLPPQLSEKWLTQPITAIVSGDLDLPTHSKIFDEKRQIILFHHQEISDKKKNNFQRNIPKHIELVPIAGQKHRLNLHEIMQYLGSIGINHVLTEAGATLSGSIIQNQLADELILYFGGKILGNQSLSSFAMSAPKTLPESMQFSIEKIKQMSTNDVRVNYLPVESSSS